MIGGIVFKKMFFLISGMGQEWDDEDQGQRRMQVRVMEARPRKPSAQKHIRPVRLHASSSEEVRSCHSSHKQQKPLRRKRKVRIRVEYGDNGQTDTIVGDCKEDQEGNRRMTSSEN